MDDGKKNEAAWRAKFAAARKILADDMRELDILQREFNLKQQQFYQDPNAALKQQYSRDDLNKTQSEIDAKKQAVERDKQALSGLEDELRKAGGDPGWAG
jgi:chromosome segregation ATPase